MLLTNRKSHKAFPLEYLYLTLTHSKGQGHAHLDCEFLANVDRWDKNCYCRQIESRISLFHWYIYIWPWPIRKFKVNVMQIWTINISQMETDRTNIATTTIILSHIGFRLT